MNLVFFSFSLIIRESRLLQHVNQIEFDFDFCLSLSQIEKSQALEFILHVADISNPAKDWELHRQWTSRIMEEFFCQVNVLLVYPF